jgi:hypothetical protein
MFLLRLGLLSCHYSGMGSIFENIYRFTIEVPVFMGGLGRVIHRNLSRRLHRHDY